VLQLIQAIVDDVLSRSHRHFDDPEPFGLQLEPVPFFAGMQRLARERSRELLFGALAFGHVENHAERPFVGVVGKRHVNLVAQPPYLAIGRHGPELDLAGAAVGECLLPHSRDVGAVSGIHLVDPEAEIREPPVGRKPEDLFRAPAHEREVGAGISG
jgi:hypothetical protein